MIRRSYRGLTLIELIATTVAIGAVLAVLVPSLAETRRRGKDVVCIQHQHRIAQATAIYSGREAGEPALPVWDGLFSQNISQFPQIPAFAYGGKSGLGVSGFSNIALSIYGPTFRANSSFRPLNRVLFRGPIGNVASRPGQGGIKWIPDSLLDMRVFRCPSDSGYTGLYALDEWRFSGLSSYDHFGTSYSSNVLWMQNTTAPFGLASDSPFLRSLSQVPNASRTIGYLENCGRYAWRAQPDLFIQDPGLPGVAGGWHGSDWTFNAAFSDGRVSTIMMRGFRSEALPRLPEPQFAQAWAAWTIRGEGWQLDTLPADPVPTVIQNNFGFQRIP